MTRYADSLATEARGEALLMPYMRQWGAVEKLVGKAAQRRGDYLLETPSQVWLDMKAVEGVYDALFIETWSNKSLGKKGWFLTSQADAIAYLYLESRELFVFGLRAARAWARKGRLLDFREAQQKKCEQYNDTWGRLIPREVLRAEVGFLWEGVLTERPSWEPCEACGGSGCPWCKPRSFGLPPRFKITWQNEAVEA